MYGEIPPIVYDYGSIDFLDPKTSIRWYLIHAGKLCNSDSINFADTFNKELYLLNYGK